MNKICNLFFFLIFIFLFSCSFDDKTGIWSGGKKEKRRILELEKNQSQIIDVKKIYTSDIIFENELILDKKIILTKPKENYSWTTSNLNNQNFLGNVYLSGAENIFLKKKIGKDKFHSFLTMSSPLSIDNSIIFSDDNGTVFKIDQSGKKIWNLNIYNKAYKKIYKKLVYSIYEENIYIADNIGFVYSVGLSTGKLNWIKNHGIPLKSNLKVYENKIFLINQDNRLICFNTKDGSKVWDVRSISSFIKLQNFLSIAITKKGNIISLNSSGDLIKTKAENGRVLWALNMSTSIYEDATDFFRFSELVVDNENVIFSSDSTIFSVDLINGIINWEKEIAAFGTPIVDKEYIFFVTKNGYFVILEKETGKLISSTNILKILKKKKQKTKITGFIMGSGKIYATTLNGYLIVSSAASGKVEYFKKIKEPILSSPIISKGKLFILTENSKIIGMN